MLTQAFRRTARDWSRLSAGLLVVATIAAATPGPALSADLGTYAASPPPAYGVACESAAANEFRSVWLGHFTGGYSQYSGPGGTILLDWRDQKLCFPSRRTCDRWISRMRHDFHHPEGYYTCLTIR